MRVASSSSSSLQVVEPEVVVEVGLARQEDARVSLWIRSQLRTQLLGGFPGVERVVGLDHDHEVVLQLGEGRLEGEICPSNRQVSGEDAIGVGVYLEGPSPQARWNRPSPGRRGTP